ncbi:hypothetical protein F4780DRAFT_794633 [Xylariomycetidae sp. FL0641]|nr:hypothetical protein F4780DRAFT_794633 [Xylariomycetidae sp. FL0641]
MASLESRAGSRILPALIDELAHCNPDRILYSVAIANNPVNQFQDITVKAFAEAVNRCAWHIADNLGPGHGFPTLTYLGPQDLIYVVLILACNKTGYKLLLNSPRCSLKEHLGLLEKTDCNIFLVPSASSPPIVQKILNARDMRELRVPSMKELFLSTEAQNRATKPYPYTLTFAEARLDPFVVLHTSGSTGSLKTVTQTHASVTPLDSFTSPSVQPTPYPALCAGKRVYAIFPLFHCGGIHMVLPGPVYCNYTAVLGPYPPSAEVINDVHLYGNVQCTSLPAVSLIDLVKTPEHLETLGNLEHVGYGGSPLPKSVGDLVATKTRLTTTFGSTEAGAMPTLFCDPEDWAYLRMSPLLGVEYRQVTENLYEQVIVRKPELEQYQGIFGTFPNLQEWPMKDMYSPHPTKKDVWLYKGRTDDVIVYSTGEKLNPLAAEGIIGSHPAVQGVLVTGNRRTQSSLLVEPAKPPENEAERLQLLDAILPKVHQANGEISSHGRIHDHMILFTSKDKPMLRAGKGTVQRQATITLYADELDALYRANDDLSDHSVRNHQPRSHLTVEAAVKDIVASLTDINLATTGPEADLFEQGLDSLQVLHIVRETNACLSAMPGSGRLRARDVYANPTLRALTTLVTGLAEGKTTIPDDISAPESERRLREIYAAHLKDLPSRASSRAKTAPAETMVFVLTGSTGSLGSYILDQLLQTPKVEKVYCLNRGPDSRARQAKSQESKGLRPLPEPSSRRVEFLSADLAAPHLGLPAAKYAELRGGATHILHGAWKVDFNQSVESFGAHLAGVASLTRLAASSAHAPQLLFLSSVGAVANSARARVVPEQALDDNDWAAPDPTGYAQSKHVAERLLGAAAARAGVPATVCRVAQVAGPTGAAGAWPPREWLPSLVASAAHLGVLPRRLGRLEVVDWVPVDLAARCVVELALAAFPGPDDDDGPDGAVRVLHVANPRTTTWARLLPAVREALGLGADVLSLPDWVAALRRAEEEEEERVPARRLLGFFEALAARGEGAAAAVRLDTARSARLSPTLAGLPPVGEAWMRNWITQWGL